MNADNQSKPYDNPYVAGISLGILLLVSFLVLGAGLGASGGIARIAAFMEGAVASEHLFAGEYFSAWGDAPMRYYLVYMFFGILIGGFLSAIVANRFSFCVEKGDSASILLRVSLAFAGGVLIGFASRMAQGCTSGQALTGGSLLLSGSFAFMVCAFAGGYGVAFFVRRQWHD